MMIRMARIMLMMFMGTLNKVTWMMTSVDLECEVDF